jgi:Ca2+-binding RTX toxin-like protein
MPRVVFVLASGASFVLALGLAFLVSNVGIAQDPQPIPPPDLQPPVECPPGSTYEEPVPGDPGVCTITQVGSPGNDVLVGSNDPRITDKMYGRGGDDRLYGYRGGDGLDGGSGQDSLYGGPEGDGLFGEDGTDTIYGGPGPDDVSGGGGRDIISTGAGDDENVNGDEGKDIISTGAGDDSINSLHVGDVGRDKISTGAGDDLIDSRDGERDKISCGPGKDHVVADRIVINSLPSGRIIDDLKDCETVAKGLAAMGGGMGGALWWAALMGRS